MSDQMSTGGIQRARSNNRNNFTIIGNEVFSGHPELSWRARGILGYLLSLPDGWNTSAERITQHGKEGREAVRTALNELETAGYLLRETKRNAKGHWLHTRVIYETPQPKVVEPAIEDAPIGEEPDNDS